jgi:hypothetical protein
MNGRPANSAVELLMHQREHRSDGARKIGDQRRIELDVERRDDGAEAPAGKPDQELFERLIRQEQHTGALADAAFFEGKGDVGHGAIERAEIDRAFLIEIDNGELLRIAPAIARQQLGDRLIWNLRLMLTKHIRHDVSSVVIRALSLHHDTGQRSCTICSNFRCLPKRATATGISA